ncbi:MAG TPA: hypothetical protein VN752_09155 [Solirubrobacterales bacterium]|nr:hypothetical protein [Solirubrobacterales bacterium]
MAAEGSLPYDAVALDEAEKLFWKGLWETAVEDAVVDLGIDMVRFGPVEAAVVEEEPEDLSHNFILGAAAPGAVEDGYLPAAVKWIERHGVDYRVALSPILPEATAARRWLWRHQYKLLDGPTRLLRDASPPAFRMPAGIDVYERIDPWEDEGFADPLAESLGLASWAGTFFVDLPGTEGWRCYCSVDGDEPLAYSAMLVHERTAVLVLASRPVGERDGIGQRAVLHRSIEEAADTGCATIAVAEAGYEPAVADRQSLEEAGFVNAFRTFTWQPGARVRM